MSRSSHWGIGQRGGSHFEKRKCVYVHGLGHVKMSAANSGIVLGPAIEHCVKWADGTGTVHDANICQEFLDAIL